MTRKHIEALAAIIRDHRHGRVAGKPTDDGAHIASLIAIDLASFCATQNAHFNRERFLRACGISE